MGFSAELLFSKVATITCLSSDSKRSDSSVPSTMTICWSSMARVVMPLLCAAIVDLSRSLSAAASCFITNLMEVLSCVWLYLYFVLIFLYDSLMLTPPPFW